ncbi:MAG: phosphatase PAP2 family protein [Anaerolineales bacterium]|nr:phosphatase PAP2 family protein [Anaerolineales bacterium]
MERLTLWVSLNRAFVWLMVLSAGLMLFLVWLPPYVRNFFWRGLEAQGILASITLGSSLLALLILWSTSQHMDTTAFLFFNTRGRRPAWLDMLMTGITQIGNSIAMVVLAFALFFAGERLLAYELVFGALTLWLVVEFVKLLVKRGRPFIGLSEARIVGHQEGGRSFPSGHTSQAFFIATLMAAYFRPGRRGSLPVICNCGAGGHYAHIRGSALPTGRVGRGYPRECMGSTWLNRLWLWVVEFDHGRNQCVHSSAYRR